MITKTCRVSGKKFEITAEDLDFYRKMEIISAEDYEKLKSREISDCVGLPTLCPEERHRERFAYRNERSLYYGKCEETGEKIFTMYDPENSSVKVYNHKYWWSDNWDPRDYGRDFDFSRDFFSQFKDLFFDVPHIQLETEDSTMEKSHYCNAAANLKNCYLTFNADFSEKCMYTNYVCKSHECVDCYNIDNSELCYESMDCINCYSCSFIYDCLNSNNCLYSANLIGCSDCFGSTNLRNKQYYFNNKKLPKEDYQEKVTKILTSYGHKKLMQFFLDFKVKQPTRYVQQTMCENCTGSHLQQCQNCTDCYSCDRLQDSAYCIGIKGSDNSNYGNYDVDFFGYNVANSYNSMTIGYDIDGAFGCVNCYNVSNIYYSYYCFNNTTDCFGCVGLKHAQYCILNKQYSKEEYFKTREKIIAHMKKTGKWGKFFPPKITPFAYNETIAQEYYPLTKAKAESMGYKWKDEISRDFKPATIIDITQTISEVDDSITKELLACEKCSKNYKIQPLEFKFYQKQNLPIPLKCPGCRHLERIKLRKPRTLFPRNCADCQKEIKTIYSPSCLEKVLCEKCYLKVVD